MTGCFVSCTRQDAFQYYACCLRVDLSNTCQAVHITDKLPRKIGIQASALGSSHTRKLCELRAASDECAIAPCRCIGQTGLVGVRMDAYVHIV